MARGAPVRESGSQLEEEPTCCTLAGTACRVLQARVKYVGAEDDSEDVDHLFPLPAFDERALFVLEAEDVDQRGCQAVDCGRTAQAGVGGLFLGHLQGCHDEAG